MAYNFTDRLRFCGCWIPVDREKKYLPQVDLASSTTILATTSRTTLKQTFINNQDQKLDEVQYTFPLYDGVSVVGFTCTVGSNTIVGVVKEKQQARVDYQEAVARGETAGLLEQMPEASDVFTTSVGNVPAREKIHIEIIYLGELKHDAETDGSRFTIPTIIAPRYGSVSGESADALSTSVEDKGGISISIDVTLDQGTIVRGLQSPSHPIAVTMGRTSTMDEDAFSNNHASATLTLGSTELDKDFIVVVLAKGTDTPRALLELHPTIPNQRAIMTTLVPKFNIPNISPEIVFVIDRSGSMGGKIHLVVAAMKIFLKSLAVGVKFNICSFGSRHSFLFEKSKTYDQSSLKEALSHLETFSANYGGTDILQPVEATIKNRYKDLPLEVMLLTDGEIWNQDQLFTFINNTTNARFFTLGVGHGASSALVEGVARAGNGFAQFVGDNEKMERRLVRMLKGALTPHITDYTLEVTYDENEPLSGDDFEMVDSTDAKEEMSVVTDLNKPEPKKPISLFDNNATEEPPNPPAAGRYDNLPTIPVPKVLQAPHQIPALYPFNRTTVYLLLGPDAPKKSPKSVKLRGTSEHGPLELEIPIQDVGIGETIHQLAAKKAVHELEQGRGWITDVRVSGTRTLLKTAHEGKWDLIVEREAVRLGVLFQVGGKWCSFVAVEKDGQRERELSAPSTGQVADGTISCKSRANSLFTTSSVYYRRHGGGSSLFGAVAQPASTSQACQSSASFSSAASTSTTTPLPGTGLFGSGPVNPVSSSCFSAGGSSAGGFGVSNKPSFGGALFGNVSAASNLSYSASPMTGISGCAPTANATNTSSMGGLFGGAQTMPPAGPSDVAMPSLFSQSPASPTTFPSPPPPSFSPVSTSTTPSAGQNTPTDCSPAGPSLAQYQSGLMILRQENSSGRKRMARQAPAQMMAAATPAAPSVRFQRMSQPSTAVTASPSGSTPMLARMAPTPKMKRSAASGAGLGSPAGSFAGDQSRQAPRGGLFGGLRAMAARKSSDESATRYSATTKDITVDARMHPSAFAEPMFSPATPPGPPSPVVLSNTDKMTRIIDLQAFDGSWSPSPDLLGLLDITEAQLASFALKLGPSKTTDATQHKATALAIAWLQINVPNEEDVWEMVVEKAVNWLAGELSGEESAKEAVKAAEATIRINVY